MVNNGSNRRQNHNVYVFRGQVALGSQAAYATAVMKELGVLQPPTPGWDGPVPPVYILLAFNYLPVHRHPLYTWVESDNGRKDSRHRKQQDAIDHWTEKTGLSLANLQEFGGFDSAGMLNRN